MKILAAIIAHPLRKISGATNAGRDLSRATAELIDLDLAVMWDQDGTATSDGLSVQYLRCWNHLGGIASFVPRFVRVPLYDSHLPELILHGNYDLVHIHNLIPTFAAERLARACQRRGVPYVISTHGFYELSKYAEINGFGRLKSALADMVITRPFQRIVQGAAGLFALSDYEQTLLDNLGVDDSKIHIVTNGVNEFYLERPSSSELAAVRAKFGLGRDPVLLYMGSLHAYKGVNVFLQSLKAIPKPFQAVVAGRFKNDGEKLSLLRDAELGGEIASKVVFTGAISNEDLRALYHLSDLFVYPTMGDTLPLVVLEAMACRLPVISTTVGGIPFMLRPGCGVLVPPGDIPAVSQAATALLSVPEQARRMGGQARARVETTFRWSSSARCALAGYEAVLSERKKLQKHVLV